MKASQVRDYEVDIEVPDYIEQKTQIEEWKQACRTYSVTLNKSRTALLVKWCSDGGDKEIMSTPAKSRKLSRILQNAPELRATVLRGVAVDNMYHDRTFISYTLSRSRAMMFANGFGSMQPKNSGSLIQTFLNSIRAMDMEPFAVMNNYDGEHEVLVNTHGTEDVTLRRLKKRSNVPERLLTVRTQPFGT